MATLALPPLIQQVLPILRSLNAEQKQQVIHEISAPSQKMVSDSQENNAQLAWEVGQQFFGSYDSGRDDLSQNAKQIVKQRIREKYRQHATH
ncbi:MULTISPECIES: hypothetical protein [unclassified Moraxella]|uniref:hypothetical protein n=1 Tax=unclassified Moraxella TaxID=2685852 RepID=UPI003AF9C1DC